MQARRVLYQALAEPILPPETVVISAATLTVDEGPLTWQILSGDFGRVEVRAESLIKLFAPDFGIEIDKSVLDRGFEYLKKCQNSDGGCDYKLGPGESSMKEGTAGGVATLGLMRKFDYAVMMNGYKFLIRTTPQAISKGR